MPCSVIFVSAWRVRHRGAVVRREALLQLAGSWMTRACCRLMRSACNMRLENYTQKSVDAMKASTET
jgi:hypothetical protein